MADHDHITLATLAGSSYARARQPITVRINQPVQDGTQVVTSRLGG